MTTKGINVKLRDIEIDKDGKVIIKNKRLAEEIKRLTPEAATRGVNIYKCNDECKE